MPRTLGLIIDNDFKYDKKLVEKLNDFNFNAILINELDQIQRLKEIIHSIPAFVIINIKSGDLEGLGIYKMLQNIYTNENIRYYFLASNRVYVQLLNELKIKVRYFLKKQHSIEFIASEIYKDLVLSSLQKDSVYKPILKSGLKELPFNILLKYCEDFYFTGNLILKRLDQVAIIQFHKGLIEKIKYQDLGMEEALERIMEWQTGSFILEARIHSVTEIKEMYEYIFTLTPDKSIPIEEVIDLYYDWISQYTAQYSLLKYLKHSYNEIAENFSILKKHRDQVFTYLDRKENTNIYLSEELTPLIAAWLKLNTEHLKKLNDDIITDEFLQRVDEFFPRLNSLFQFGKYYENFDPKSKSFIFRLKTLNP